MGVDYSTSLSGILLSAVATDMELRRGRLLQTIIFLACVQ